MTCLVEVKLQLQAAIVIRAATEAHVAVNVLFDLMSGNWLVRWHEIRMNLGASLAQVREGFSVNCLSSYQLRDGLFGQGLTAVQDFEFRKCAPQFPALQ